MKIITEAVESSEKTQNGSTQPASTEQIILEAELDLSKQELKYHNETTHYQRAHYSVSALSPEVIRMETGLPTKEIFNIVVRGLCGQIQTFYIILCWMESGIHNI